MIEPTAEVATVIDASPKRVWEALTDPALICEYFMGSTVATDWKVGSPITFSGEWKGKAYQDKGEILTVEPQQRLCFSHWSPMSGTEDLPQNYHVVEVDLSNVNEGTEVTLRQSNLEGGVTESDRANRLEYEKNWSNVLAGLKRVVER